MNKSEVYDMGKEAEKLLNNKAFIAAMANLKSDNFNRFCNVKPDDVEGMKSVNISMGAIDSLERELKDLVISGNNAAKQMGGN